jgi:AcrR family transcriptional regulator
MQSSNDHMDNRRALQSEPSSIPSARIAGGAALAARRRPASGRRHPSSERQSSEAYFDVAFGLLARCGSEGVTVANLCDELGVTKGSFYYHFTSMPEFVEAFVDYWATSVASLLRASIASQDPLLKMSGMTNAIANLSHEAEAALRAWGHSNPVVEEAGQRIDDDVEAVIAEVAAEFLPHPSDAGILAHQAVALIIGLQHRRRPISRRLYLEACAGLAELTCGVEGLIAEEADGRVSVRFRRRIGSPSSDKAAQRSAPGCALRPAQ